jgi:hypothetical protein
LRAQQRQQLLVDAVIVGEPVHADDRRILTWDLAGEATANRHIGVIRSWLHQCS